MNELAKANGKRGSVAAICRKWEITAAQAKSIRERFSREIAEQRQALSIAGFEIAGHIQAEIVKDLNNPKKMAATGLRDKAMAYEKVINGSVTAADGHVAKVNINFGEIRAGRGALEAYEKEKRAKGRVV